MKVQLLCGPEGATNSSFGLYRKVNQYRTDCVAFVDSDWEYPSLASSLGWVPCQECNATDGTVDCQHKTASAMLADAYDFLYQRDGETFNVNDEYVRENV